MTEINITVVQVKQEMMSVTNNSDVVVEVSRLTVLPQFAISDGSKLSSGCISIKYSCPIIVTLNEFDANHLKW